MTNTIHQTSDIVTIYIPVASTVVVSVATVILVGLTASYVRLTKRMLGEMRDSKEPAISVDFEMVDHILRLVVTNDGGSVAKNIKFTVTKDLVWIRGRKGNTGLASLAPVVHGISHLVPGRTLKYYVGVPQWSDSKDRDLVVSLHLEWENEAGKVASSDLDVDMIQLKSVLFESFKDPSRYIADAIKDTDRRTHSRESMQALVNRPPPRKPCPSCCELVMEKAKKCFHCGESI